VTVPPRGLIDGPIVAPGTTRPRENGPFPVKKLVISVLVVVVLLVAGDFGAKAFAENQVSQQLHTRLQLRSDPQVTINGFPFLYQAATGDFRDVQLQANGLTVGQLSDVGLVATLHDARFSTADLISGSAKQLEVDQIDGQVRLSAADVAKVSQIKDLNIKPAQQGALGGSGGDGTSGQASPGTSGDPTNAAVELDGSVNIAGTDNQVQVIAEMSVVNGQLKVQPRKLNLDNSAFGSITLPKSFQQSLLQQFAITLDPGMLPLKVTPTGVRVEQDALLVDATAHNVTLGSDGVSSR
jgi:hypothetical protein